MADHMADKAARARVPKAKVDASPSSREGFQNFHEASGPEAPDRHQTPEPDAETEGSSVSRAREGVRSWLHATFPGHENAVAWGFVGFLVALLLFVIGFWRTLVVVLLVVVGVAFGQVLDGDPKIINTVRGLFGGDDAR